MKLFKNIREKIGGLLKALSRYPLTVFLLVAAVIVNAIAIEQGLDYMKYVAILLVGACLGFTLQALWERFFEKITYRFLSMGLTLILTLFYFFMIRSLETFDVVTGLRTIVILSTLGIAYIWVPSFKSKVSFSDSFLTAFKAFFNALLFSIVLVLGLSLILGAIDLLLFKIPGTLYEQSFNIVGIIFAPIYFLSLIPIYPGVSHQTKTEEELKNHNHYPRFLEILISYIIIPLLSLYTVILVVYIVVNVRGNFWTDNRLEPMLVGFAIAVIVIYILASNLNNSFVLWFRKIFPKVLVFVVLFQIIASILKIQETGITHGRYYVILFGFFAILSGIIMSLRPLDHVDKNGMIAILFIGFSLFSIIPPLDAFTISRNDQMNRLTNVLIENDMLKNQEIISNSDLSKKDQKILSETLNYLVMMDYKTSYLKEDFDLYEDFYETFGFYQYIEYLGDEESIYLNLDSQATIDISNYDILMNFDAYYDRENEEEILIGVFEKSGKVFSLFGERKSKPGKILLKDEQEQILMEFEMKDVFNYFKASEKDDTQSEKQLSPDEATFTLENERVILSLVAKFIAITRDSEESIYNGDFYVMIKIKE